MIDPGRAMLVESKRKVCQTQRPGTNKKERINGPLLGSLRDFATELGWPHGFVCYHTQLRRRPHETCWAGIYVQQV